MSFSSEHQNENSQALVRLSEAAVTGRRLSPEALAVFQRNRSSHRALALGVPSREFRADSGLILGIMADNSGSMGLDLQADPKAGQEVARYNPRSIRPYTALTGIDALSLGHNAVIDALKQSPNPNGVLVHARCMNVHSLYEPSYLEAIQPTTPESFPVTGATPLYRETIALLNTQVAKFEEMRKALKRARLVSLIISDGADSTSDSPEDVRTVITSMRDQGHIVTAMGINNGASDFGDIFVNRMGIDEKWVIEPGSTVEEILKAFGFFAETAVQATTPEGFKQLALGPGYKNTGLSLRD